MDDVGIFVAIWYILRLFGIFMAILVYFSRFSMLYQEKSVNHDFGADFSPKNEF
jgi:hypothetical protein